MRGYRPGTRVFVALLALGLIVLWLSAGAATLDARDRWVMPWPLAVILLGMVQVGIRPRLQFRGNDLIIDQPVVRWVVPCRAVIGIESPEGEFVIQTRARVIYPFTFSPSLIAHFLGDKPQKQARAAVKTWWFAGRESAGSQRRSDKERLTVGPLLQDAVACVAIGWATYICSPLWALMGWW